MFSSKKQDILINKKVFYTCFKQTLVFYDLINDKDVLVILRTEEGEYEMGYCKLENPDEKVGLILEDGYQQRQSLYQLNTYNLNTLGPMKIEFFRRGQTWLMHIRQISPLTVWEYNLELNRLKQTLGFQMGNHKDFDVALNKDDDDSSMLASNLIFVRVTTLKSSGMLQITIKKDGGRSLLSTHNSFVRKHQQLKWKVACFKKGFISVCIIDFNRKGGGQLGIYVHRLKKDDNVFEQTQRYVKSHPSGLKYIKILSDSFLVYDYRWPWTGFQCFNTRIKSMPPDKYLHFILCNQFYVKTRYFLLKEHTEFTVSSSLNGGSQIFTLPGTLDEIKIAREKGQCGGILHFSCLDQQGDFSGILVFTVGLTKGQINDNRTDLGKRDLKMSKCQFSKTRKIINGHFNSTNWKEQIYQTLHFLESTPVHQKIGTNMIQEIMDQLFPCNGIMQGCESLIKERKFSVAENGTLKYECNEHMQDRMDEGG